MHARSSLSWSLRWKAEDNRKKQYETEDSENPKLESNKLAAFLHD